MMDIALEPAAEGETATATSNPDAMARLSDAPKTADVGTSEATDDAERDSAPLMRRGAVGGGMIALEVSSSGEAMGEDGALRALVERRTSTGEAATAGLAVAGGLCAARRATLGTAYAVARPPAR